MKQTPGRDEFTFANEKWIKTDKNLKICVDNSRFI